MLNKPDLVAIRNEHRPSQPRVVGPIYVPEPDDRVCLKDHQAWPCDAVVIYEEQVRKLAYLEADAKDGWSAAADMLLAWDQTKRDHERILRFAATCLESHTCDEMPYHDGCLACDLVYEIDRMFPSKTERALGG